MLSSESLFSTYVIPGCIPKEPSCHGVSLKSRNSLTEQTSSRKPIIPPGFSTFMLRWLKKRWRTFHRIPIQNSLQKACLEGAKSKKCIFKHLFAHVLRNLFFQSPAVSPLDTFRIFMPSYWAFHTNAEDYKGNPLPYCLCTTVKLHSDNIVQQIMLWRCKRGLKTKRDNYTQNL